MAAGSSPSTRGTEVALLRAEAAFGMGDATHVAELLDELPKTIAPAQRVRAQRLRGRALLALGRPEQAVKELEHVARQARSLGEREIAIRTLYDLAQAHEALDQPGAAVSLALECDARLQSGELIDRTLELQVRSSLAIGFARLGDARSAQMQADRALEIAQDVTDKRATASLYSTLTKTRQQQGDYEAALTYAHRAVVAMEALGQAAATVAALNNVAWIHVQRAEFSRADQILDRALELAQRENLESMRAVLAATRAEARLAQGKASDALKLATEASSRADTNAQTRGAAMLIEAQARAALDRTSSEVRDAFARAINALRTRSPRLQARAHRAYGEYLASRGKQAEAYAEVEKAIALLEAS